MYSFTVERKGNMVMLLRPYNVGLTVNRKDCIFNKDSIYSFGTRFTSKGMQLDPAKVEDLQPELKSFLGMANFSARLFG